MLVQLMSAENSNELVCEASRVLSVPKKKKKVFEAHGLSRKGINVPIYI